MTDPADDETTNVGAHPGRTNSISPALALQIDPFLLLSLLKFSFLPYQQGQCVNAIPTDFDIVPRFNFQHRGSVEVHL